MKENYIEPITLLDTGFSKALDNFEGIDSYTVDGKEYLLLISDDNGDWNGEKQQTLLLNFKLLK
ncbi:hypothetical protein [Maribellus maritimus]|uniref:hypothetical protein n=1 Tax=Maribellus maritimus TaxID=2870838 RepID=UPI001EEA4388|nr:hypothetical protein [Maribellus maritimus]MCG6186841.1 hypothetical protein [Maribellus maritimus]